MAAPSLASTVRRRDGARAQWPLPEPYVQANLLARLDRPPSMQRARVELPAALHIHPQQRLAGPQPEAEAEAAEGGLAAQVARGEAREDGDEPG